MADFDALIAAAHAKGLKVILDFVPNHTSKQHPWFRESRSSRDNPKRDWYIWREGKADGSPPNNWISQFGGPAWTRDEATGQFYLHSFLPEQPDLNWRNPEVREAMFDVLRFWIKRGVDGFRVDVIWLLIKDEALRDNPVNPGYQPTQREHQRLLSVHNCDQPEVHHVIAGMRAVLDHDSDRVLIGEIYLPMERLVAYYGQDLSGAHLPFNFQLIQTAWSPPAIAKLVDEYEAALPAGGWPNWVLGNHDQPRIAARVGVAQARIAALLLLTLRGTPTMYYGDELGVGKVHIPHDAVQDPWEKNEPGLGLGRDPARTPMAWDATANAGFSEVSPWLPLDPQSRTRNVEACRKDKGSILCFYRELLALRRRCSALHSGGFRLIGVEGEALVYERADERESIVVCLNFGASPQQVRLPAHFAKAKVLISTDGERADFNDEMVLRPDEGVVLLAPD
jgi:alpha-glucosidase